MRNEGTVMAKTTEVSDKIIQALADYLKRDATSIHATHHLRDDLGLDSMAVIEMLYRIEEVFNLQIPDQDLVGLTTVGQVIAYVQGRVAASPAAAKKPRPSVRPKGIRRKKMTTAPRRDPLTLRQIHELVGGELIGSPDATVIGDREPGTGRAG